MTPTTLHNLPNISLETALTVAFRAGIAWATEARTDFTEPPADCDEVVRAIVEKVKKL